MYEIADQMLALLVMDLGYIASPVYGSAPIRHQLAWNMVSEIFSKQEIEDKVKSMMRQMAEEKA